MIKVETNEVEFRANYKKLRRGLTPNMALRRSGKTLAARLMAFTPPSGDKDASPRPIGALEEGMKRVANDIRRAVRPFSDDFIERTFGAESHVSEWLKRYADAGDVDRVKKMLNDMGYVGDVYADFPRDIYRASRGAGGRVKGKTRAYTLAVAQENAYIRVKQDRVGMAKGGWYAGATVMGLGNIAPWITDHAGMGSVTDQSLSLKDPYIEFINRSVWARYNEQAQTATANAIAAVERDIARDFEREIERAAA